MPKRGQRRGQSGAMFQGGWRTVLQVTFDLFYNTTASFSPWEVWWSWNAGSIWQCRAAKEQMQQQRQPKESKFFWFPIVRCNVQCKWRRAAVQSLAFSAMTSLRVCYLNYLHNIFITAYGIIKYTDSRALTYWAKDRQDAGCMAYGIMLLIAGFVLHVHWIQDLYIKAAVQQRLYMSSS